MSIANRFIPLLDRPSLRFLLGGAAHMYVRWTRRENVKFRYNDNWTSDDGTGVIVDSSLNLHSFSFYSDVTSDVFLWDYQPQAGDVIVDVGAGIGTETLTLAKGDDSLQVMSIEAHPRTFACLQQAVHMNNLKNVNCLNVAAAEEEGTLLISEELSHLSNHVSKSNRSGTEVPARRLDTVLREFGIDKVGFLKMNIEGAEVDALKGLGALLAETRNVAISCHDFKYEETNNPFFKTKEKVSEILRESGFELKTRESDSRRYVRDTVYGKRIGVQ